MANAYSEKTFIIHLELSKKEAQYLLDFTQNGIPETSELRKGIFLPLKKVLED